MNGALSPGAHPDRGLTLEALSPPRWLPATATRFPARLRPIAQTPPGLWIRSALPADDIAQIWEAPAVAIVGARAASAAGIAIARELAWGLARAGVVVISGLALGIDAAGHEGALLGGGMTVAVLASGLDQCYPPEHTALAVEIGQHGALLSEWEAGTQPLPWRFPRRNRLISGLADLVVLVEGEARSGALHTVRFGLEQGREVMAVPRDPILPGSVAPNRLLRDGASPAGSAADVLALLRSGRRVADEQGSAARPLRARLLGELSAGSPQTAAQLAGRLPEVGVSRIMALLIELEVEGRVRRDAVGRFRCTEVG